MKSPISGQFITNILDALPFGVSWATLPGAHIQYSNRAFDELFGYPSGHFQTAEQLIEETYIHEKQRVLLEQHWQGFELVSNTTDIILVPEVEIDILGGDGQIHSVQHFGLIIPEQKIGIAFYKDVSHTKRYNKTLKEYAFLDPLTGVGNRRALQERWRDVQTLNPSLPLALLMIDLDGFKPVNDTYGHQVGDAVLCVIASRLKEVIRKSDAVYRLGGDEFCLLLEVHDENPDVIYDICQRIIETIKQQIIVEGHSIYVSASVGGCFYPDQAVSKQELLRRADIALYQAKRAGRGIWKWWDMSIKTGSTHLPGGTREHRRCAGENQIGR
ncbi:GGDEF domain-containing protein [Erwinia sp. S43]|nr:GGDEF domain-containing protein [Erwinia sp. S43]